MDRGQPDSSGYSRTRWIRPETLAGVRLARDWGNGGVVDAADDNDAPTPVGLAEVVRDPNQKLAGLVALYAVDEYAKEPEHPMPECGER